MLPTEEAMSFRALGDTPPIRRELSGSRIRALGSHPIEFGAADRDVMTRLPSFSNDARPRTASVRWSQSARSVGEVKTACAPLAADRVTSLPLPTDGVTKLSSEVLAQPFPPWGSLPVSAFVTTHDQPIGRQAAQSSSMHNLSAPGTAGPSVWPRGHTSFSRSRGSLSLKSLEVDGPRVSPAPVRLQAQERSSTSSIVGGRMSPPMPPRSTLTSSTTPPESFHCPLSIKQASSADILPVSPPTTLAAPCVASENGRKKAVMCPQGHLMTSLGTSRDDGWDCDARNEPGGCLSGITSFNQTVGMQRYHCTLCAYDLCDKCASTRDAIRNKEDVDLLNGLLQQSETSEVARTSWPPAVGPPVEAPLPDRSSSACQRNALCADPRGPLLTRLAKEKVCLKALEGDVSEPPALVPMSDMSWHADWSIRIGPELDSVSFAKQVMILDKDKVFSVNQAVEALNRGSIQCKEELCAAYSASSGGWFLLHKRGQQDLGMSALGAFQAEPVMLSSSVQPPLAPGTTVYIGGHACQITTAIGMGSFGAVWAAELADSHGSKRDIAVKEIHCQSRGDLQTAMYECQLLQILDQESENFGGASGSSARPSLMDARSNNNAGRKAHSRIPAFVAMGEEQLGPSHWRVRLAMSKVPGIPLDSFLELRQRDHSSPSSPSSASQRLAEACRFTHGLISQLAPTFERISAHALHRDINSHNVLIDAGNPLRPSYGIVDFGLAVNLSSWRGPNVSPASWHLVDIGGDCRYWPMAAWLQFEGGWQELAKYPALAIEYETQLDLHAMGITALQVWSAMAYDWSAQKRSSRTMGEVDIRPSCDDTPEEVTVLLTAWGRYWKDATFFWQKLLDCFRNQGDQNALKGWCIAEGVHNAVGQHLADVRTALRMVCDACGTSRSTSLVGQQPLFEALLELISAGGTAGVHEGQTAPSWQGVRAILEKRMPVNSAAKDVPKGLSGYTRTPHGGNDSRHDDEARGARHTPNLHGGISQGGYRIGGAPVPSARPTLTAII